MVPQFAYFGLVVGVLAIGFERYRTRFRKRELMASLISAFAITAVALAPGIIPLVAGARLAELIAAAALVVAVVHLRRKTVDNRRKFNSLVRELALRNVPIDTPNEESVHVVLPAYDEAETIADVVESIPDAIDGRDVVPVVVSDGSTDGTARAARATDAIVAEHAVNTGQCSALKTGFEIARRRRANVVVGMDADGQHRGDELRDIVAPILAGDADYVIGSRYRGTDSSDNGIVRRAGIWAFTGLINVMTKSTITDATNGFRAITIDGLEKISWTEERFCAVELLVEVRKNGLRLREIPVTIERRQASTTKKPKLGYGIGIARTLVASYLR